MRQKTEEQVFFFILLTSQTAVGERNLIATESEWNQFYFG